MHCMHSLAMDADGDHRSVAAVGDGDRPFLVDHHPLHVLRLRHLVHLPLHGRRLERRLDGQLPVVGQVGGDGGGVHALGKVVFLVELLVQRAARRALLVLRVHDQLPVRRLDDDLFRAELAHVHDQPHAPRAVRVGDDGVLHRGAHPEVPGAAGVGVAGAVLHGQEGLPGQDAGLVDDALHRQHAVLAEDAVEAVLVHAARDVHLRRTVKAGGQAV